jgi:diguanylate cyclase (GGDEF)-like protein
MAVLSLRRRLTLLVALTIVVPITAVGVTVVNLIGNEVDQRSYDRLHQAAAFVQGALNQGSTDVARAADALAADPRTADAIAADGSGLDDTLRRALVDHDLDVVVVQDEHGAVVGSARRDPQYAPGVVVPADEDLASGARDLAVLTARAPLATGTVVTGRWIDAFRLRRVVAGDVTFTLNDDGRSVASTASVSLPHRALDGDFRADLGGHRRLAFATPAASGSPFTLVATTRPSAAGGRTNLILIFGALLLILTILIVLVGHVVSGLVTGPVEDLVIAALAVSRGDLTQRVKPAGDVELAALGRAFNQMTDNLQEHVAQLEQSRTEFQAAMARLGDVLVSTHDIGGIIDVVLEACTLTLHADEALFFERVAMPARIRASAAQSWSVPALELNGTGVAGAAAKALALVTYPAPDIELAEGEPEETVAMAVPVVSDGRLFGVIAVYGHHGDDPFDERDVNTLQTLARQAEVAIGNVHLHDETRRQARTDGTTGLWNRREFELRARESVKEAARFHEPFGVILVDIDNFKQVNDRYDHSTGDAALIWLASKLSEATREIDVVARWGGEEFIVLLPRAGAEESAMVAERIRSTIAQEPMVDGPKIIPITVSIGMACHPDDGATPDSLFKAADAALLRAKRMGKNRVERARPEEGVA